MITTTSAHMVLVLILEGLRDPNNLQKITLALVEPSKTISNNRLHIYFVFPGGGGGETLGKVGKAQSTEAPLSLSLCNSMPRKQFTKS